MQNIKLLITDLDDTVFNWFDQWHDSFAYLLKEICKKVRDHGFDDASVIAEIKTIHERVQTSEYSFLIDELPCIAVAFPNDDPRVIFETELKEYKRLRQTSLRLFPGVKSTLTRLKSQGVRIVAYTESMEYHTIERIRILELDGLIDVLFSRDDHSSPEFVEKERLRSQPEHTYHLRGTKHTKLEVSHRKPAPEILTRIVNEACVELSQTIYIGDSQVKDIGMAKAAGITSVLVDYSSKDINSREYELLKKVTHWTASDVETERTERTEPTYRVSNFAELLALFEFESNSNRHDSTLLEIWNKSIDVQMHFNDIQLRIRSLFISVITAIIAATGAVSLTSEKTQFFVGSWQVSIILLSLATASLATALFYLMDRHWYHRFLQGAVSNALKVEKRFAINHPEIGLSNAIGKKSRFPIRKFGLFYFTSFFLPWASGAKLRSTLQVSSDNRLELFYLTILKPAALVLLLSALFGGIITGDNSTVAEVLMVFAERYFGPILPTN